MPCSLANPIFMPYECEDLGSIFDVNNLDIQVTEMREILAYMRNNRGRTYSEQMATRSWLGSTATQRIGIAFPANRSD